MEESAFAAIYETGGEVPRGTGTKTNPTLDTLKRIRGTVSLYPRYLFPKVAQLNARENFSQGRVSV